ncbi:hypothetical protein B0A55_09680 [Friedmanniomyces simplex]|uniref:F-box domain-containing protein n=1 Tax=Friedmanniomyces simplex TaxID=329884 RepID=A0A4U0X0F6_9PEZI|nr:hypothetical protein B0A55_09680 [Friedmanniomyces simplex]
MAAAAVFSVAELLELVLLLLPLRDLLLARSVNQDLAATIDTKKLRRAYIVDTELAAAHENYVRGCSAAGSCKRWRYTAVQVTHRPLGRVQPEEMPRAIPAQTTERPGLTQAPNGQMGVQIRTLSDGIVARRDLPRDGLTPRGNSPARVLVASRHGPMWAEWILYETVEWRLLGRSVDETTGWEMLAMPDAAQGQPRVE